MIRNSDSPNDTAKSRLRSVVVGNLDLSRVLSYSGSLRPFSAWPIPGDEEDPYLVDGGQCRG